jgi:hypothetical protein
VHESQRTLALDIECQRVACGGSCHRAVSLREVDEPGKKRRLIVSRKRDEAPKK